MFLTIEEGERLIQTIMTREQWYNEEPHDFTERKVYYIEDMEGLREVIETKGKLVETLKSVIYTSAISTNGKTNYMKLYKVSSIIKELIKISADAFIIMTK